MDEQQLEQWKMKKTIKSFENARGNGTSMISLILPPNSKIGGMPINYLLMKWELLPILKVVSISYPFYQQLNLLKKD